MAGMTRTITANERPRTGNCASVLPSDGYSGEFACAFTPGHRGSCIHRAAANVPPRPLAPVYNWLVEELSFPLDMRTAARPEWLDVRWLAELWRIKDGDGRQTTQDYVDMILYETGWDTEGTSCRECGTPLSPAAAEIGPYCSTPCKEGEGSDN